MSDKNCILVFCETNEGDSPEAISLEALGLARNLSDPLDCDVFAAMCGTGSTSSVASMAARAFIAEAPSGGSYNPEWHVAFMEAICKKTNPLAVLFGHTPLGQDVAARLAARLGVGLVSDSVGVKTGDGGFLATKQVQGGIGIATYAFRKTPQIITVRPRVGKIPDRMEPRRGRGSGEVIKIEVNSDGSRARWELLENVCEECGEIRLDEAEIVVSGGRGMGGAEGFGMVAELAKTLGGAVGSSRPPCDMGWIKSSQQVGITGAIISPQVYFAVGISGASQHLSGMCDSKTIVAINKDPEAEIFKVANYGVVGDYKQILPAMINKIKELTGRGTEK